MTYTVGGARSFLLVNAFIGEGNFPYALDRSRTVGAHLQRGLFNCYSLILRVSQVGRVR